MIIVFVPNNMETAMQINNLQGDDRQLVNYLANLSVEAPREVELYDLTNVKHMEQFVVNNNMGYHADKLALLIEREMDEFRDLIDDVRKVNAGEEMPMLGDGEGDDDEGDDWED